MSGLEERFSKPAIDILARRAANICSNPDCGAITSGPAEDETRAINVGEAAHIYGARAGSARFDPEMTASARGEITNAIWLCRNCHKLVDADPNYYPAGLLFEWRRAHERRTSESVGKAGALARERFQDRQLEEFRAASYLAQQIVLDKPEYWEYRLTAELLRSLAGPILARWRHLERGLYTRPSTLIPLEQIMAWHGAQFDEMQRSISAMNGLINEVFTEAWGEPGVPGSERDILRACALFADLCEQLLLWEEHVRFAAVPSPFEVLRDHMVGIAGHVLNELAVVPRSMSEVFSGELKTGTHDIKLTLDLPDEWVEQHKQLLEQAIREAFA